MPLKDEEQTRRSASPVKIVDANGREEFAGRAEPPRNEERQRKKNPLTRAVDAIAALPPFHAIGNLFYALGFYAEGRIVLVWRVLRDAGIFFGQLLVWLFGGFFSKLGGFFKAFFQDLTAPFARMFAGGRKKQAKQEALAGPGVAVQDTEVKSTRHLAANLMRFLLPVGAVAVFIFVLNSILGMNYALAVEIGGELIGYVDNETVLEDGLNLLRMKIILADDQSLDQWEVTPTLSVAPADHTLTKTQVSDLILQNSSDEVMAATGIYVDGELKGATTEGERLQQFLQSKLDETYDPEQPQAEIGFVREVDAERGEELFFADSVKPYDELVEFLSRSVSEQVDHVVMDGETLSSIAHTYSISIDDLINRNPTLEEEGELYQPEPGTLLVIRRAEPYLQVYKSFRDYDIEPVPFEEVERESDKMLTGTRRRVQEGEDGEERVWYDNIYVDGELLRRDRLDELTERIKDPQDEIYEVGTIDGSQFAPGTVGADYQPGNYLWPVPEATYSSRGYLSYHGGIDINAPIGTPIHAANAGTVTFAGEHYSYGLYVEIQHPDGLITRYAHCSQLLVSTSDPVGWDQIIALVGSTGYSTGPHCHFEVVVNGARVDPAPYVVAPW